VPESTLLLVSIFIALSLSSCATREETEQPAQLPNPASLFCIESGGRVEIVKEEEGERGICHLPDGTVIDEWELYRREHQPTDPDTTMDET